MFAKMINGNALTGNASEGTTGAMAGRIVKTIQMKMDVSDDNVMS